jgi:hypothetical protein
MAMGRQTLLSNLLYEDELRESSLTRRAGLPSPPKVHAAALKVVPTAPRSARTPPFGLSGIPVRESEASGAPSIAVLTRKGRHIVYTAVKNRVPGKQMRPSKDIAACKFPCAIVWSAL